jgi:hypothetical protein
VQFAEKFAEQVLDVNREQVAAGRLRRGLRAHPDDVTVRRPGDRHHAGLSLSHTLARETSADAVDAAMAAAVTTRAGRRVRVRRWLSMPPRSQRGVVTAVAHVRWLVITVSLAAAALPAVPAHVRSGTRGKPIQVRLCITLRG